MATLKSLNPATGDVVGEVTITPVDDIPGLVATARAAQPAWQDLGMAGRLEILKRAGELLVARAADIGELACHEMGKPIREAKGEASFAAGNFSSDLDEIAEALAPEIRESKRVRSVMHRDGFGVAVCISPWNFPVLMPHQQVLPALAAGNTVLFKPSEETPLVGQAYADALLEVLPEGVLTVVHGADQQGKALVAADIDLIVFTGSRAAGKHILAAASGSLKRVILELGGKDPLVVLEGADVAAAAKFAAGSSFRNAGQVCISTERIYVADSIHDEFVNLLCTNVARMPQGDGAQAETRIGPMVNTGQREHVQTQVAAAVGQGAVVSWQGEELGGNYVAPVVLTGIDHSMDIAMDETFGPVACVIRVDSEAEAVSLANDTPYGLGAVVYGEIDDARRVARKLTAGMIGINQGISSAGGTPWVGARQSGYGFHSGRDGHRQFAQIRVLSEPI